ncbi:hypothetical protein Ddc_24233 [Ditylenchus destructor]|nr:hypothetical protein Ddc_24233 [Ditylenchus destructor]
MSPKARWIHVFLHKKDHASNAEAQLLRLREVSDWCWYYDLHEGGLRPSNEGPNSRCNRRRACRRCEAAQEAWCFMGLDIVSPRGEVERYAFFRYR